MDNTTRKPWLLFQSLSGLFLLRYAQRALCLVLFQEPPRTHEHAIYPQQCQRTLSLHIVPFKPTAKQAANFLQQTGAVFVLVIGEHAKIMREPQIDAQRRKGTVSTL